MCCRHRGEREEAIWTGSHCSSDHTGCSQNSSPAIITVRVGRNNDNGTTAMGTFLPSAYSGALSFRTPPILPPLSGSHSFFTPLEIVLLTWVDKSFFVFSRLFTLCLCTTGFASFKRKSSVSAESEHLGKSLLLLIWKSSFQSDNWQHTDRGQTTVCTHSQTHNFPADTHAVTLISHTHTQGEINFAPAQFKCVSGRTTKLHHWQHKTYNSPF